MHRKTLTRKTGARKLWAGLATSGLGALALPGQALAQVYNPAGSPAGSGPVVAAVNWVQGTLLGNVATAVAVIAIAVVGFMMLTGRMNWKHGITVILGCFILFGASVIVAGIQGAARLAG